MKQINRCYYLLFTIILFAYISCTKQKNEDHVSSILTHILNTKTAIENYLTHHSSTPVHPVFVSFWDFDGTILKGDCSEGYEENGTQIYKGLVQVAIEQNLSKFYKPNEFNKFYNYYQYLDKTKGHHAAYTYLTTIFAGHDEQALIALSTQYFNTTLQHFYFASSLAIMKKLTEHTIGVYIISASPQFFVKGAAKSLNLNSDHLHGIQLKTVNGKLTHTIINPVTYAEGKTVKMLEIIQQLQKTHATDHVYAIAAFGNSYHTDGPFLRYVAMQKLPAGTPIAVMINGGTPPEEYKGLFHCVEQSHVIGKEK